MRIYKETEEYCIITEIGGKEIVIGKIAWVGGDNYLVTFMDDQIGVPACGLTDAENIAKEYVKYKLPQITHE